MRVGSMGREDSLEEDMATHCSILPQETPWKEEPSGLSLWGCRELDKT